jgi:DMSO/TMAO reductase YedYZ heme-binding membrane subunit
MSHAYRPINWTPFKRRFDVWMLAGMAAYLLAFVLGSTLGLPAGESFTPVQMLIRATGTLAFLQLSFLLCIGPLARLTPRFKPFLYNRRHLGVATFLVALVHGVLVTLWYHGFGELNPLWSLLVSNPRYDSLAGFPFEVLGLLALVLLFLLAAISGTPTWARACGNRSTFWSTRLTPCWWRTWRWGLCSPRAIRCCAWLWWRQSHPWSACNCGLHGLRPGPMCKQRPAPIGCAWDRRSTSPTTAPVSWSRKALNALPCFVMTAWWRRCPTSAATKVARWGKGA